MKKSRKNKLINQTSFYFEDYFETNKKSKDLKKNNFEDRNYLLFFFFFSLITIFSLKIVFISLNQKEVLSFNNQNSQFSLLRRDIVDRKGIIISRNINAYHAAVDPKLVIDKKLFNQIKTNLSRSSS